MRVRQTFSGLIVALLLVITACTGIAASGVDQFEIPDGEVIAFSPDGQWLLASHPIRSSAGSRSSLRASLQSDDDDPKLCVYAFPSLTPRSCTAPGVYRGDNGPRGIVDAITWSPDGDSIAFSEGSVRTNSDGDIWQLETDSGRFTNLTDDNFSGQVPLGEKSDTPIFLDTNPSYSPDGDSIAFVRITIGTDGRAQPSISRLNLTSGEVELIATLSHDPFQLPVGNLIWSADASTLWFTATGLDESMIGLFFAATDGSTQARITPLVADSRDEIVLLEIDTSESVALVGLNRALTRLEPPYFALIDLQTGEPTTLSPEFQPDEPGLYDVTFTPEGDLLFAVETRGEGDAEDVVRLVRQDRTGGSASLIATDLPDLGFSPLGVGLTFITDDLVAYPINNDDERAPWAIVSLSGIDPLPATPAADNFPPGTTVLTTADVALRTTPSVTGALSQALSSGTELIVIDGPVEVDSVIWIPVREPVSGALGYVPSAMITLQSD